MALKKYFSSSNKNAPQITNSIGCLIPVLDYVLCNGSTPEAVASIFEHDGFYTVATLLANGYQAHQTINFTGVINGEYIIREIIDGQRFKIKKKIEDPVLSGVVTNTTCKLNALGFNKAFGGTNKAVYQSSDLSETCRPYLRVDDGSVDGYPNSWLKAAMIGMLEECNGIDDFNSGYGHQPLGLSYQENWQAHNIGNSLSKGCLRWMYSSSTSDNNWWVESFGGASGGSPWFIVGDSKSFVLLIQKSYRIQSYWMPYAFGVLEDSTEDIYKGFVVGCTGRPNQNNQSSWVSNILTNINHQWNSAGAQGSAFIMRPFSGAQQTGSSPLSFYVPTKQAFSSGSSNLTPSNSGNFLTLKNLAYDSGGFLRGVLPCIESLGSTYQTQTHGALGSVNKYHQSSEKFTVGIPFECPETYAIGRVGFVNLGEYDD
jgi:hypothetical protein